MLTDALQFLLDKALQTREPIKTRDSRTSTLLIDRGDPTKIQRIQDAPPVISHSAHQIPSMLSMLSSEAVRYDGEVLTQVFVDVNCPTIHAVVLADGYVVCRVRIPLAFTDFWIHARERSTFKHRELLQWMESSISATHEQNEKVIDSLRSIHWKSMRESRLQSDGSSLGRSVDAKAESGSALPKTIRLIGTMLEYCTGEQQGFAPEVMFTVSYDGDDETVTLTPDKVSVTKAIYSCCRDLMVDIEGSHKDLADPVAVPLPPLQVFSGSPSFNGK